MHDPHDHINATSDIDELRRLAHAWLDTAAQHARNEEFYRNIVHQTGLILGRETHRQDDGNYTDQPLALRVPEVAQKLVDELATLAMAPNAYHPDPTINAEVAAEAAQAAAFDKAAGVEPGWHKGDPAGRHARILAKIKACKAAATTTTPYGEGYYCGLDRAYDIVRQTP